MFVATTCSTYVYFVYLYFRLHWVFVLVSGGCSLVVVLRLLTAVASHCGAQVTEWSGFSSCGAWV